MNFVQFEYCKDTGSVLYYRRRQEVQSNGTLSHSQAPGYSHGSKAQRDPSRYTVSLNVNEAAYSLQVIVQRQAKNTEYDKRSSVDR